MKDKRIGFIGLGNMGSRIAARLARAGYKLNVFDLSQEAVNKFVGSNEKAIASGSAGEVFISSNIVFISLPGSPQVEKVMEEAIKTDLKGKIIVDLSTSRPDSTQRLCSLLKERDCIFMDAPLTGGPRQAEAGELNIITAGNRRAHEKVMPLFRTFGRKIFYAGDSGNGHAIKLINNSLSGIYVCLYAEILPLIRRFNINPELFMQVIGVSGGNSPMFQIFAPKMLKHDFSRMFSIELMDKDFSYIEKLLEEKGLGRVIVKAARNLLSRAKRSNMEKEDVSSLIKITGGKK